jgi:hypothetical protein
MRAIAPSSGIAIIFSLTPQDVSPKIDAPVPAARSPVPADTMLSHQPFSPPFGTMP